jgi:hypothetical protein
LNYSRGFPDFAKLISAMFAITYANLLGRGLPMNKPQQTEGGRKEAQTAQKRSVFTFCDFCAFFAAMA